jgi:hypothetical protein
VTVEGGICEETDVVLLMMYLLLPMLWLLDEPRSIFFFIGEEKFE